MEKEKMTPELYNGWLHILMHCAKSYSDQDILFESYRERGGQLNGYLHYHGLPSISGSEYLPVWGAVTQAVNAFIQAAPDKQNAAGTVLWRFIKAVHPDIKNNTLQAAGKSDYYRQQYKFRQNMMKLLEACHLPLYAHDKINALSYFQFRYNTNEYRKLYNQFGKFNYGEVPEKIDYECLQSVKIFHEILALGQKSSGAQKIVSAQAFLETVAANPELWEDVVYQDVYGNKQAIDIAARQKMHKLMKASKVPFSSEAMAYFSGQDNWKIDVPSYVKIVLAKAAAVRDIQKYREIVAQPFARIHHCLRDKENVSAAEVVSYASYLSHYASAHSENETLRTDLLENLLYREAETQNRRRRAENLFPSEMSAHELPKLNKALVAKVAFAYANSFAGSAPEVGEFNPAFHKSMAEMFGRIVTDNAYTGAEVKALRAALETNSDVAMKQMSRKVQSHYAVQQPRRPLSPYQR